MRVFMGGVLVAGVQTGGLCAVLLTHGQSFYLPIDPVGRVAQKLIYVEAGEAQARSAYLKHLEFDQYAEPGGDDATEVQT